MRTSQREQVYAQINAMMSDGLKRSHAIRRYAQQTRRPIDSIRRDFNEFLRLQAKALKDTLSQTREAALEQIRDRHELLTVMHLCDVHFPFQHPPALELAYQMVKLHQPQIVVIGSDEFDLDLMSSFDADATSWDETPDIIDALRALHHNHVDRIRAAAPNAVLLFIDGNHEDRYRRWVNSNAPKLRNTLNQAWVDMITYHGQVYHVGAREVEICNALIVRHGDRHNIHAAKSLIEQEGYQVSVIAGHTHRPQEYHAQGRRYGVVGATSGCLSTLTPKYLHGKPSNWKHGTAIARVHHPTGCVTVENVTFIEEKRHMLAITGNQLLRTHTA